MEFQNFYENKLLESEKWSRKSLDGKCDGYMWGPGGAQKQKCWFFISFTITFLRGQEGHEYAKTASK